MKRLLLESEKNVLTFLYEEGAAPIDGFWLGTCCNLIKAGLVQVYTRNARVEGENPSKAFVSLTSAGTALFEGPKTNALAESQFEI